MLAEKGNMTFDGGSPAEAEPRGRNVVASRLQDYTAFHQDPNYSHLS